MSGNNKIARISAFIEISYIHQNFIVACIFICSVAIQVTKSIDTLQDSKINSRNQTNSVSIPSIKKNSKSFKKIVRKLSLSDDDDESLLGLVPEEKLQEDLNDDMIPSSPPHKKVNFVRLIFVYFTLSIHLSIYLFWKIQ